MNVLSNLSFYVYFLNFICHFTVFFGGLYIAVHSRCIPNWLRTCLWYIGCSSFLVGTTIALGWIFGPSFDLSYDKLGIYGETIFNIMITLTTATFFLKTLAADVKFSKSRRQQSP